MTKTKRRKKARRAPVNSEITSVLRAPAELETEEPAALDPEDEGAPADADPLAAVEVEAEAEPSAQSAEGAVSAGSDPDAETDTAIADRDTEIEGDEGEAAQAREEHDEGGEGEGDSELGEEAELPPLVSGDLALPEGAEPEDTETFLCGLIEALLFTSQRPLALKELARAAGIDRPRAKELLERLVGSYGQRGVSIEEVAGGYIMRSSPRYAPYIHKLLALRPVRLSRAQLETLAIVAYRQPVTKPEVDEIRGVDTGQVLKGLLERNLLKILGKKDEPGRPMLYGTTNEFLELLSLQSLKDLPTLREYTELSEESRRKFADATGEPAPEPGSELADDAGESAVESNEQASIEASAEPLDEPTEPLDEAAEPLDEPTEPLDEPTEPLDETDAPPADGLIESETVAETESLVESELDSEEAELDSAEAELDEPA